MAPVALRHRMARHSDETSFLKSQLHLFWMLFVDANGSEWGDRSPTHAFNWLIDDCRSTTGGHKSLASGLVHPEMDAPVVSDVLVDRRVCKIRMTSTFSSRRAHARQRSTPHLILLSTTARSVSDRHLRRTETRRRFQGTYRGRWCRTTLPRDRCCTSPFHTHPRRHCRDIGSFLAQGPSSSSSAPLYCSCLLMSSQISRI